MSKAVKSPKASASPRGSKESDDSKADAPTKPPYKTDSRGDAMMAEAQKKLNKSAIFGFMSSSNKYEDAIELILKAAAQYKVSKNWQEAGDAYVKAGEIYEKNLKESHDACTRYIEAARAYRNVDTKAAIKYFVPHTAHARPPYDPVLPLSLTLFPHSSAALRRASRWTCTWRATASPWPPSCTRTSQSCTRRSWTTRAPRARTRGLLTGWFISRHRLRIGVLLLVLPAAPLTSAALCCVCAQL